ncbi:MAG: DUF934 domain-containing protein [Alphaproteobacteria bacterium]|nr:DUF934 domain-containing protein [Alphaproteobacteria bacterium]
MPLIKGEAFVDSVFTLLADEQEVPAGRPIIVSLKRWQSEREQLKALNVALGVRLTSDQAPDLLGDDIHSLAVIALEFPKFRDGRGYSWARMLRQRLGYKGEIRAVGDVLRDQWLFMSRCGVDAFEVKLGTRIEEFRAAMGEQTVFYQPSSDRVTNVLALRHNRGVSARRGGLAQAAE